MAAIGDYDAEHGALIARLREQLAAKLDPERDLWDCCPAGSDCWHQREKPPSPHRFRVPYVGPSYTTRRIVLVGMNSRDNGRHEAEYVAMGQVLPRLREGAKRWGGSYFHYRAGILASMLAAVQDGVAPETAPTVERVVEPLLASARVQAVQCAPGPTSSRRGPKEPMWTNCPPFILSDQIRVLEPRAVVLLGTQTLRAVQRFSGLEYEWTTSWRNGGNCFARGTLRTQRGSADLFAIYHPSSSGWPRSLAGLRRSLQA